MYELLMLGLLILIPRHKPISASLVVLLLVPVFISAICGWAAHALLTRTASSVRVATAAFLIVSIISVWIIKDFISLEAAGVHSPETLFCVVVLVFTELLIALHLVQRKWKVAA